MKLIFVHGRANERLDPTLLKQKWLVALEKGLTSRNLKLPAGVEVEFPYYGDQLDQLLLRMDMPLIEGLDLRHKGPPGDEDALQSELLAEMAEGAGISDDNIRANYSGGSQEKGPLNWEWTQATLRAFDQTPIGVKAIDRFTRDVSVYLKNKAVRKDIDATIQNSLPSGSCVVVGHSLGSVVGYSVLRTAPTSVKVHKYITVGSPLDRKAETEIKALSWKMIVADLTGCMLAKEAMGIVAARNGCKWPARRYEEPFEQFLLPTVNDLWRQRSLR